MQYQYFDSALSLREFFIQNPDVINRQESQVCQEREKIDWLEKQLLILRLRMISSFRKSMTLRKKMAHFREKALSKQHHHMATIRRREMVIIKLKDEILKQERKRVDFRLRNLELLLRKHQVRYESIQRISNFTIIARDVLLETMGLNHADEE